MTRAGVATLVMAVTALTAGLVLHWTAFSVIGIGLLVLLALCGLLVARPSHLQLDRAVQPPRVAKGDAAIAYLTFVRRGWTSAATTLVRQPFGNGHVDVVLPRLRRGEQGVRVVRLPTSRRGVFDAGPLQVTRSDPFALFSIARRHAGTEQVWVQPRALPLATLPAGRRRHLEGPSSDASPQGTVTFHRLREYVEGDDLRLVHWPSSARAGRLVVRHNVDTSQPYTVVLLDLRAQRYIDDTFEEAVDVAASVVMAAGSGKAPVELRLSDGTQLGGTGAADLTPLLDRLTTVTPNAEAGLAGQLLALRRLHTGTTLVVVTGRVDAAELRDVAALRRSFDSLVVASLDPAGAPAAAFPGVRILAGADAEQVAAAWNVAAGLRTAAS